MPIQKHKKEDIDKLEDKTDYERVNNMTEAEIKKNAQSDSDAPLQSKPDLENFKPARNRRKRQK